MRVLITGITGQDGSYLAESLLATDDEVHGIIRRRSSTKLIDPIIDRLHLHQGDITDQASLDRIVSEVQPDQIFHLAAQSFVGNAWRIPEHTIDVTGLGTLKMLEATRKYAPQARFYFAATSEMFGAAPAPQNESTVFHPRSPYGCAKVLGFNLTRNYRESYGMFAVSGILNNHESPRRGVEFVTRKISLGVARILYGKQSRLELGSLTACRDWGHAKEYVEAMRLMMDADSPRDYVVGTGVAHSVLDFVEAAFDVVKLNWRNYVVQDERLVRLAEVRELCADAKAIRQDLGWEPKITFKQLVQEMVKHDLELVRRDAT